MRLEGQRTLVTGGSRGIGRGIALGMARQGADVAVNFKTSREDAEDAVEAAHRAHASGVWRDKPVFSLLKICSTKWPILRMSDL